MTFSASRSILRRRSSFSFTDEKTAVPRATSPTSTAWAPEFTAHLAETHLQMTGRAGERQVPRAGIALLHGDGGVLSSHVSLVLEAA